MYRLKNLNCIGKKIIVRVDYNVPFKNGMITDIGRIRDSIDTIKYLIDGGAVQVILISHLGKPDSYSQDFSLFPVSNILADLLGTNVGFSKDLSCTNEKIILLENLRFYNGEEKNDIEFAKKLSLLADVYVNDAFSCSHRNHASIVTLPTLMPSFIGLALEREIKSLDLNVIFSSKPVVAIIGGSKISTKLPLIKNLQNKVDKIILCGALANTVLKYNGYNVGKSLYEDLSLDLNYENIVMPHDVVTSTSLNDNVIHVCDVRWIPEDEMILDIGPASIAKIKNILSEAKTVLWNGPLGAFEFHPFDYASSNVGKYISDLTKSGRIKSILGGGDTLAMISKIQDYEFSYISSAGGAFLKWLESSNLVGIEALLKSWKIKVS